MKIVEDPWFAAWQIWLQGVHLDTVFYWKDMESDEVLKSLLEHDGYPLDITIKRVKTYTKQ